ncbi:MAG TPA: sugar-binding domain-containing protein [Propionibacteriaceae bacterium]|nr:sugar-binding domain-containing protein [Propionibacteriaceae bacterium]
MSDKGVPVPSQQLRGPAELVLATLVARRYYIDGRTKIEIGDEFRLSRFKVARLLDSARNQGLVRIEISYPGAVDVELSAQLRETFALEHAIVVNTHDEEEEALRKQLGLATAELLSEVLTGEDVLGLAWARTVRAMVTELRSLPAVPVVQLTGALSRSTETSSSVEGDNSIDVVREAARIAGGPAYLFFAPLLVPDGSTAQALHRQPDVARALIMMGSVSRAVMGVGRWAPAQSTLYDAATEPERRALAQQGVCAEIGGVFLGADGEPLHTSLNERMVAMTADQMRAIPDVIAIPYGVSKRPAVHAALRSGLVNSLVTHSSLATALIGEP